jgi:precorrin-6B methylase 2
MAKQWTAPEVLQLARGYHEACVLAAAADLELFEVIGSDEVDAREAAGRIRGDLRATTILLDALAALQLLAKRDGRYSVPERLAPLLIPRAPGSVLAMVQHQATCLRRWARLAETVRTGAPLERAPSVRGKEKDRAAFIEAMDVANRDAAPNLVHELTSVPVTHLLDVGGASGTWTIAWLTENPAARATLFDLAPVIPQARERLGAAGLLDRVTLVAGDFHTDPLPAGADLAWISAIVHQNSREQNRELFRKVHAALVPGGRVLVRDIVMDPARIRPVAGALFAVNMLTATTGGGTFTLAELREDLEAAGFRDVAQIREDERMNAVVGARRAG